MKLPYHQQLFYRDLLIYERSSRVSTVSQESEG